jgi:hypothetical protein
MTILKTIQVECSNCCSFSMCRISWFLLVTPCMLIHHHSMHLTRIATGQGQTVVSPLELTFRWLPMSSYKKLQLLLYLLLPGDIADAWRWTACLLLKSRSSSAPWPCSESRSVVTILAIKFQIARDGRDYILMHVTQHLLLADTPKNWDHDEYGLASRALAWADAYNYVCAHAIHTIKEFSIKSHTGVFDDIVCRPLSGVQKSDSKMTCWVLIKVTTTYSKCVLQYPNTSVGKHLAMDTSWSKMLNRSYQVKHKEAIVFGPNWLKGSIVYTVDQCSVPWLGQNLDERYLWSIYRVATQLSNGMFHLNSE